QSVDGAAPVRPHAEKTGGELPALAPDPKLDRNVLDRSPAALQDSGRVSGSHPSDVDADHTNTVSEAGRRAGERKTENDPGQANEDDDDRRPVQENRALAPRRPPAPACNRRRAACRQGAEV